MVSDGDVGFSDRLWFCFSGVRFPSDTLNTDYMEYKRMINEAISLEEAVQKVKANEERAYKWFAVKNSQGSYFELGGNKENLKAYIPEYENKKIVVHSNGFVRSNYSVQIGSLQYPKENIYDENFLPTEEKLLQFLDSKDFETYSPNIKKKAYPIEWEYKYKILDY